MQELNKITNTSSLISILATRPLSYDLNGADATISKKKYSEGGKSTDKTVVVIPNYNSQNQKTIYTDVIKAIETNLKNNNVSYKFINKKFQIGNLFIKIESPKEYQNWGNINENIMALAIGCRFLFKNRDVKKSDYYRILEYHFKDKINTVHLKSANKGNITKDNLEITLSNMYRNELYTERQTERYKKLLESNIKYVNNAKIKSFSLDIYNNGVQDDIKVESIGKSGKKEDVKISIKNRQGYFKEIDISAKLNVNQFGQYAGTEYKNLNEFLKNIFGNDLKIERVYTKVISGAKSNKKSKKDRTKDALELIYRRAVSKAKKSIKIQSLFNGINEYMSGNNKNLEVVEIKNNEFSVYDSKKLNDFLSSLDPTQLTSLNQQIELKYSTYGTENLPKIEVNLEDKLLITVRVKYEKSKDVFRNYIEKGPKLEELIKV